MCKQVFMEVLEKTGNELTAEELVVLDGLDVDMTVEYKEQVVEVYNGKKFYNDVWTVSLTNHEQGMDLEYTQGEGWYGEEPQLQHVLYALLSDYFGYKDSQDFEDYCHMYGMDVFEEYDSLEDEDEDEDESHGYNKASWELYLKVEKQADDLERLFTEEELRVLALTFHDF